MPPRSGEFRIGFGGLTTVGQEDDKEEGYGDANEDPKAYRVIVEVVIMLQEVVKESGIGNSHIFQFINLPVEKLKMSIGLMSILKKRGRKVERIPMPFGIQRFRLNPDVKVGND